jgi:hypothetical protein
MDTETLEFNAAYRGLWSSFQVSMLAACPSTARDLRIAPLIRRQGHIAGLAWDLAVNNSVSGRLGS